MPAADARSLFVFAALHDSQRVNDHHDPEHGERAAEVLAAEIDHGLDPDELATLQYCVLARGFAVESDEFGWEVIARDFEQALLRPTDPAHRA